MADREWFVVDYGPVEYPNIEAANDAAETLAADSDRDVEICRCTTTVVRRYRREVTILGEDVIPATTAKDADIA